MIKVKQLQRELEKFTAAHARCLVEFNDPLYIAWQIDFILDGKAPVPEIQKNFQEIMKARRSKKFRDFWNAYKNAKIAISNFQSVNMGVIARKTAVAYLKKFKKEHPEEVPF